MPTYPTFAARFYLAWRMIPRSHPDSVIVPEFIMQKAPITTRAVIQRINRKLRPDEQVIANDALDVGGAR